MAEEDSRSDTPALNGHDKRYYSKGHDINIHTSKLYDNIEKIVSLAFI